MKVLLVSKTTHLELRYLLQPRIVVEAVDKVSSSNSWVKEVKL